MNLQSRLTESLKASQSALRVISQLESLLAEKEKVIERYRKALMEIVLDRTENLGNPTWASRTATSALQEGEGGKNV